MRVSLSKWHETRGAFIRTLCGCLTYVVLTLRFVALSLSHDIVGELLWAQMLAELTPLLELQRVVLDQVGVRLELEGLFSRLDRWIRLHHHLVKYR